MALVFFTNREAPVQCALEISRALKQHPAIKLRMGLHSGPLNAVSDVNDIVAFNLKLLLLFTFWAYLLGSTQELSDLCI